jgi:hypothetical protein
MPQNRWLVFIGLYLFASLPATAQAPAETPACGRALGGNYDVQPAQEKQARRVGYANCWRSWADGGIRRAYGTILREVSGYQSSLRAATYGVIRAGADTAAKLQRSEQQSERAALERRYDEEARAILQQATAQNRAETNQRRGELRERTRAEGITLQERHTAELAELQDAIKRAYASADEEIARRVQDDFESLAQQHRAKLRDIDRGFGSLANAPPGQSIADYESEQEDESDGEWSFFRVLHSLFVYTSGLVGKAGPEDDPPPVPVGPYGSLGIRG